MAKEKKIDFSWITMCLKSLKNTSVVLALPALLYLLDHYIEWCPSEYQPIMVAISGFVGYCIKNKATFKAE